MNRYIKLYEEFVETEESMLTKSVEVTFRLILKEGVDPETIKNKFYDKFIELENPPFIYKDFIFEDFEIDFVGDVEISGSLESEYAVKSNVKFKADSPFDSKVIDHYIKNGIQDFLEEKRKEYISDETEGIGFMQFELYVY